MTPTHTTDPQSELLIEVDSNNEIIGPITRGEAHQNHKYYRTIYILVKNSQDQILIQQRSSTKDLYPNCWDLSVGGHVGFGQTYRKAAIQELAEELNLKAGSSDLNFKDEVLVHLPQSHEFFHLFDYQLKASARISFNSAEIQQIRWLTLQQINQSIQQSSLLWYPRPIQIINALT